MPPYFYDVLVPRALNQAFTYTSCDKLTVGQVVQVPFGRHHVWGIVTQPCAQPPKNKTLKSIIEALPLTLSSTLRTFFQRVARYTLTPEGAVLKMVLSCPEALEKWGNTNDAPSLPTFISAELSDAQESALQALSTLCVSDKTQPPKPCLFEGVTGSGKTEVYLCWLAEQLKQGGQALVLLPEIALTPQWCLRFEKRFGGAPTLWHAHLTPKARREAFTRIVRGEAQVVVGARSALFLPYPALRAIVVDEEHDLTFKQEETVLYHARDMAVLRANVENIPIVLASATPSLESLANVQKGKYTHVTLKSRFQGLLPEISTTPKQKKGWLSDAIAEKLTEVYAEGGQSLIFLNRRGYASFVRCETCHHTAECPSCAVGLVYHKKNDTLLCHTCGFRSRKICPACGGESVLALSGLGVEKLKEEVAVLLPKARTHLMSSDVMTPKRLTALIHDLEAHKIDILIGTQMVAKGHHFPGLTFVLVLDIDHTLHHFDFRAHEHAFQLLTQLAGRAGRGENPGDMWIQTCDAEHPLLKAILHKDYATWAPDEQAKRKVHNLPPHARMAALILSGTSEAAVKTYAQNLATFISASLPEDSDLRVLGPIPAPLPYARGRYRWRFLVRADEKPVQPFLKHWLSQHPAPSSVRVHSDVDPYDFM